MLPIIELQRKGQLLAERVAVLAWNEDVHLRGKTTPHSRGGSFAPRIGAGEGISESESADKLRELYARIAKPDGGFTYQPKTGIEPSSGFAVSPFPERSFSASVKDLKYEDVVSYIKKNRDLFSREGFFMGAWNNPKTGRVFLDVSMVKRSQFVALSLARRKDQIAIFDLSRFKSITVNQRASSGGTA